MTNLCTNCEIKSVCKINDFMKTYADIVDLTLNGCSIAKQSAAPVESLNAPLLADRPIRQYQNFKGLSKQVKEETKKRSPVVSIIKEETTEAEMLTVCNTCGGTTYVSDVIACTKCGKETCSNCRTEIVETGQKLCDDCWSEE